MEQFASDFGTIYRRPERELSASFEIGCFHALVEFYRREGAVSPENLTDDNEYRYLTSPSGDPKNFSYVTVRIGSDDFTIRQQLRVRSHVDPDIAFTPDLIVLRPDAVIRGVLDPDFANATRRFFFVNAEDVVAAHECKSMTPFPELMVSFLGMVFTAHPWIDSRSWEPETAIHLAPSLFVGGTARTLHLRMVRALERAYPLNVILGLHYGTMNLLKRSRLTRVGPKRIPVVPDEDLPF